MDKTSITKSTINRPFGFFEFLYSGNVYSRYLNKFINSVDPEDGSETYDKKERIITWCFYDPEIDDYIEESRSFEKKLIALLSPEFLFSETLFAEKLAIYAPFEEVNRFLRTQEVKVDKIDFFITNNEIFKDYDIHNRLVIGLRKIISDNRKMYNLTSNINETPLFINEPPKLPKGKKSTIKIFKSFEYVNLQSGSENITYLLKDLKSLELISEETELKHFRNVFSNKDIENKIVWTGSISLLSFFIKQLLKQKKVEIAKQKQWFFTIKCFEMSDGSILDNIRLKSQQEPKNTLGIETLVKDL